MRIGARSLPTASRNCAHNAATCAGLSTLRAKRMKPKGLASLKKSRSTDASSIPWQPYTAAFAGIATSWLRLACSRRGDKTIRARRLQLHAGIRGRRAIGERSDAEPVDHAFRAQISTLDVRRQSGRCRITGAECRPCPIGELLAFER